MISGADPAWREACIRALCKCRHADLRLSWNFRRTIERMVEFHKDAPQAMWDGNQSERLDLCRVAYREQLGDFAPAAPIRNWKDTRFVGERPTKPDEFVTWRGEYRPFTYHLETMA